MPLEIVLEGPSRDSLKAPERLQAIARIQSWLNAQPEVDYTASFSGLIEEMHRAFNGQEVLAQPLPTSSAMVDQYLLFYDGRDLADVVDEEFKRTRILANLNIHGANALNQLLDRIAREMATNPSADLHWDTAGMGRLFADQERLLIQGQVSSLYAVAGMITLLMLILWGNLRFTLISILPNFAPVLLIFAVMAILKIWLDMATAMVASVAIGIAIDDTIHLLHGIKSKMTAGVPLTPAIARTIRHRGRALVATTLVLCAQFLLVASSPFQPTAIFGALTALGLVFALVFDLLVLPSLVMVLLRKGAKAQGE
jgi:predicted RND superfamily exporter protein